MTIETNWIVFPEGETQELPGPLRMGQLVDLNGRPLPLPLPTARMIAYRVVGIRRKEERGSLDSFHKVELVPAFELAEYL